MLGSHDIYPLLGRQKLRVLGSHDIYAGGLYRIENKCLSKNWMIKRMTPVFGKLCFNDSTVTILWQLLLKIHHLGRHLAAC